MWPQNTSLRAAEQTLSYVHLSLLPLTLSYSHKRSALLLVCKKCARSVQVPFPLHPRKAVLLTSPWNCASALIWMLSTSLLQQAGGTRHTQADTESAEAQGGRQRGGLHLQTISVYGPAVTISHLGACPSLTLVSSQQTPYTPASLSPWTYLFLLG